MQGQLHSHLGVTCGVCGRGEALKASTMTGALKELHEMHWRRSLLKGWLCPLCAIKDKKAK